MRSALALRCAWALTASVCRAADVVPATPPDLTVTVKAGRIALPGRRIVSYPRAALRLDPPAMRNVTVRERGGENPLVPRNHAKWYESWEPWPRKGKDGKINVIALSPRYCRDRVPILGGLYRSFVADSVKVTSADGAKVFKMGVDYTFNADWGQIANLDGRLGKSFVDRVKVTGRYAMQRLDLIQVDAAGKVSVKEGHSAAVCPALPQADAGAAPLAGVYIAPWRAAANPHFDAERAAVKPATDYAITQYEILPVKPAPPVQPINKGGVSRTFGSLAAGRTVRIALMGDSITLGAEAGPWWDRRIKFTAKDVAYRGRVIHGLRQRFPKAKVTPIEAYKGGTTAKFGLQVLDKDVLPNGPDLVVMAFGANDAAGPIGRGPRNPPEQFKRDMLALVRKAKGAGVEVMLVVGMQMNPWLKNGATQRWGAYRKAILDIGATQNVAVADVYTEWMNLASRGIPPFTQLHNWINHPGAFGHGVYADVVLRFFEGKAPPPPPEKPRPAPPPKRTGLTQPSVIPGKWKLSVQPLPPLAAVVKRPVAELPVYGLYTWCGEYRRHRDSIKKVGWRVLRIAGPMDDATMAMLAEDGIDVMMTLGLRVSGKSRRRPDYPSDDAFIADYVKAVRAFLTRYGPGGTFFKDHPKLPVRPIRHVEVWNEPNYQYMIPPRPGAPRKQMEAEREALYAKVLPAAFEAVKKGWPKVTVVGFGAGGSSKGDVRFIQHVLAKDANVPRRFDVLSTHPYAHAAPPEADCVRTWGSYSAAGSLAEIRQSLSKHRRGDTPVWYTEVGWPVSREDGGRFTMAASRTVPPALQAAYVCRMYALAMRLGVDRVNIMFATDTDNYNGGFFLRDGSWRPSAHAVRHMIALMPRPKLVGAINDGKDGFYAYRFQADAAKEDGEVIMAWNVAGPKTVSIPWRRGQATIIDMLGREKAVAPVNGKLSVEVGPCPVYVR